jgi:hypothetical protein
VIDYPVKFDVCIESGNHGCFEEVLTQMGSKAFERLVNGDAEIEHNIAV